MCSPTPWLVFINIIFFVISLVVLIIGTIIQTSLGDSYSLFNGYINAPAALTITCGALLSLTAMLAFISIYCRSRVLLSVYVFVVTFLIVIELSVGATYVVAKSYVLDIITGSLRSAESKFANDHFSSSTWNSVQRDLKCCGVDSYKEWFYYLGNSSVPDSCCILYTVGCGVNATTTANCFQPDCATAITEWADGHALSMTIFLAFIVSLQLLSLLFSWRCLRGLYRYDSIESFSY